MPQYTCPKCKTRLAVADDTPPGTSIECPSCQARFRTPAAKPAAAAAAPIPFKDDPPPKPADEDDDNPYLVAEESEEEKRLAEATKPKFTDLKDKFAKSARGPAMSLLVMPSNLMVAEGGLTIAVGFLLVIMGAWPVLFGEASPSDEELADGLSFVFYGGFAIIWGVLICFGASNMQNLGSYTWAMVGAILAILPLLAGVFAIITLQDPRVQAGFREPETGPIKVGKKDDEDDEEEDDEEEEEERPKKKRKR
jgi:uncharacterized membrane protein